MDSVLNSVNQFFHEQGFDKTYFVAFSGGLDSHVLLHLCWVIHQSTPLKIKVVHVNHGISPHALDWQTHCASVASKLGFEFQAFSLNLASDISNLEAVARQGRYALLAKLLLAGDCLLTAHHQNDQAETVLLQLLRGAGPKGLAAMPKTKSFALGTHARPLLSFARDELKRYALVNRLCWLEDESNENLNFSRNFLRQEVIPLLQSKWPSITQTLPRVAKHVQEAQRLVEELAKEDLLVVSGKEPNTLSVTTLKKLSIPRQKQALRLWIERAGISLPSAIKMDHIIKDALHARLDRFPIVSWQGNEIRRFNDELFLMSKRTPQYSTQTFNWPLDQTLTLKNGSLIASPLLGRGLSRHIRAVTVKFRQGGETFRLPGRVFHQKIKKIFQDWEVPPWERSDLPLLFVDNQLVAIVGVKDRPFVVDDAFAVENNEIGWLVKWEKNSG